MPSMGTPTDGVVVGLATEVSVKVVPLLAAVTVASATPSRPVSWSEVAVVYRHPFMVTPSIVILTISQAIYPAPYPRMSYEPSQDYSQGPLDTSRYMATCHGQVLGTSNK